MIEGDTYGKTEDEKRTPCFQEAATMPDEALRADKRGRMINTRNTANSITD